ncbi:neprilysin-2-like [Belonocnema kinseyi]|uniref:neprilysin-2-like n=1 Tax=Belonocnema kinseyi TaxID=2817044 RepID=UPI00143E0606|nr:neprilysin-2-like [Belonocnema kinseyi]
MKEFKMIHALNNKPKNSNVCLTTECKKAASIIRQCMNPNVAPCDDFYQFACGNYTQNAVIPKDKSFANRDSLIEEKVKSQLKISIEEKIQKNEPRSITLAKNFYKACMDTEGDSWKGEKFDWKQTNYAMGKLGYGTDYLFTFKVSMDSLNSTKSILNIDQPPLGINREYLIKGSNNRIVNAYYNFTVEIAVLLSANRARAENELKESLEFEIKLANCCSLNPMTVKQLSKKYPSILWKEYLNSILQTIVIGDNELEAATNVSIFWAQHFFNQLRQPVNKADWTDYSDTTVVNAFNRVEENSIVIPAGILQDIYFDEHRPQYMNYAVIGSTIGHEVSHGFDTLGSQYDKNGNLKNWWTPEKNKNFLREQIAL